METARQYQFSPEEWARVKRIAAQLRAGFERFVNDPSLIEFIFTGRQHVYDRFNQLVAMSEEELLAETAADFIIYGDALEKADEDFILNYDSSLPIGEQSDRCLYKHIRARLDAIAQEPALLSHVSPENTYFWNRLAMLTALSETEYMNLIEADVVLFKCG